MPGYDGQGNVAALMKSDGAIAAVYEYGPFGELLRKQGDYAKDNPFRNATKYTDEESGMVYYGYRYYNPETSRWLSRDPIGEAGGFNLYGFVSNDPLNVTDYLGLNGDDKQTTTPTRLPIDPEKDWGYGTVYVSVMSLSLGYNSSIAVVNSFPQIGGGGGGPPILPPALPPITPPKIKLPCSIVALAAVKSAKTNHVGGSDSDASRLMDAMVELVNHGGELGAALILGWANATERDVVWKRAAGLPRAGRRASGAPLLHLARGSKDFTTVSLSGSDKPKSASIIIGHELGHAVIGLLRPLYSSPLASEDISHDLGLEAANVLYVENVLRASYAGEDPRLSYSGELISELSEKNGMADYLNKMKGVVDQYVKGSKDRNNCY